MSLDCDQYPKQVRKGKKYINKLKKNERKHFSSIIFYLLHIYAIKKSYKLSILNLSLQLTVGG